MERIMSNWYTAYSLDGLYRQTLDKDPFKAFDSQEEVKEALENFWAVEFHREGTTVAIVKETYNIAFGEDGNFVKTEHVTEVVEHYTVGGKHGKSANIA